MSSGERPGFSSMVTGKARVEFNGQARVEFNDQARVEFSGKLMMNGEGSD